VTRGLGPRLVPTDDKTVHLITNPFAKTESAFNPGRDVLHSFGRAYDCIADPRSEIYPDPSETYNCTTCLWGEKEHPVFVIKNPDQFRVNCTLRNVMSEGPRHEDIACPVWDRRKDVNSRRLEG
jgi:hypothetical protein